MLSGRPTLRHPEGTDRLEEGDIACFPAGPEGAHAVRNDTDQTVRVLMFSNRCDPAATVYPDSGKVALWTGNTATTSSSSGQAASATGTARRRRRSSRQVVESGSTALR